MTTTREKMGPDHPGFLIWNPDGRMPTCSHDTLPKAKAEAERLAREAPGQSFFILAPVLATCAVPQPPVLRSEVVTRTESNWVPF